MASSFPRKTHRPFNRQPALPALISCHATPFLSHIFQLHRILWFLEHSYALPTLGHLQRALPLSGIFFFLRACGRCYTSSSQMGCLTTPLIVSSPTLGFSLLVSSFFMPLLHSDDFTGLFACYFCVYISCPFFIGNFKCIFFLFQQYIHLEIA